MNFASFSLLLESVQGVLRRVWSNSGHRTFDQTRGPVQGVWNIEHIYSIKPPWGRREIIDFFFSFLFLCVASKLCVCVCSSSCDSLCQRERERDALVWVDETFMNREQIGLVQDRPYRTPSSAPSFLFSFVWSFPTEGKGIKKTQRSE